MNKKIYNYAVIVGRFEPIHLGHEKLINKALECSNKTLIMVTTSNKDIIDINKRIKLINVIYEEEIKDNKLEIVKFNNPKHFDLSYGDLIFKEYYNKLNNYPEVIIYGDDKDISKCFSDELIKKIDTVVVKRDGNSATKIRTLLKENKNIQINSLINKKLNNEITKSLLTRGEVNG